MQKKYAWLLTWEGVWLFTADWQQGVSYVHRLLSDISNGVKLNSVRGWQILNGQRRSHTIIGEGDLDALGAACPRTHETLHMQLYSAFALKTLLPYYALIAGNIFL